jgi:hypothetical protein
VLCAATGAKKFTGRFRSGKLRMQTIPSPATDFASKIWLSFSGIANIIGVFNCKRK